MPERIAMPIVPGRKVSYVSGGKGGEGGHTAADDGHGELGGAGGLRSAHCVV